MIYILLAIAAVAALYRFGNTPESAQIDEKIKSARDEHYRAMYRSGVNSTIVR